MTASLVMPVEGEHLRFYVRSRTEPGQRYLVDLQEHDFNGQCGCEDFLYRCGPKLKGKFTPGDVTRCWHIRQARAFICDKFLPKLAEHQGQLRTERTERTGRKVYRLHR